MLYTLYETGFYAATPMRYAAASLILNTAGSIGLFFAFREWGLSPHLGIAIATSVGGWLNALLLWKELRRRGHFVADRRLLWALPMIVLAALAMATALWFGARELSPWLGSAQPLAVRGTALALLLGGGAAIYFALAFATGALRLGMLRRAFRRSA